MHHVARRSAAPAPLVVAVVIAACASDPEGFEFESQGSSSQEGGGNDSEGASAGDDTGEGVDGSGTEGGEKFDVASSVEGTAGDESSEECQCGDAGLLFSHIWIANSSEGTVSKLDTQTMAEMGRYITRPDGAGNPSRTSVTIDGRAVAVANRHGGITKIWARTEDCVESNGTPGIQTSTGANDVLPWGEDECVAWYTAFPEYTTQRPVAWTAGTLNPATCEYQDQKLWTSGCGGGQYPGFGGPGGIDVLRLDGATGEIDATIAIPGELCSPVGAYGGAVDGAGDFWFNRVGEGPKMLGVVRNADLSWQLFDLPQGIYAYGMTVDAEGRPWVSGVHAGKPAARFDPQTSTWGVVLAPQLGSDGGMQEDALGRMWVSAYGDGTTSVIGVDSETLAVTDKVALPEGGIIKGISVDVDGYVWAVSHSTAYRISAMDHTYDEYDGLVEPYTYSDMTGWGLFHTECPTPEG